MVQNMSLPDIRMRLRPWTVLLGYVTTMWSRGTAEFCDNPLGYGGFSILVFLLDDLI